MIKIFKDYIIPLILMLFTAYIVINPYIIINSVNYSVDLFIENIFPTLFPFFIISELLINYNITYIIGACFKRVSGFLFNINASETFAFILSIFSGQPSNAKYIKDLLDRKIINESEATNLLSYTFFPSPMFVLGTIGTLFYNDLKIGIIILATIYLSNIITGVLFRNKSPKTTSIYEKKNKPLPFGETMHKSIINAVNILMLILGSMTIFVIITNVVSSVFGFNDLFNTLLSSLLEITQGAKKISILEMSLHFKIMLTCVILCFGGLSVHSQVKSILYNYKIKYSKVIKARTIASILACTFSHFILLIINV